MRKVVSVLIMLMLVLGYFVGNYFVEYALKRGSDGSPPVACSKIADPTLKVPALPTFAREHWELESEDDLKLVADHFSPKEPTHRWALLIHGYGRDRRFAYDYAQEYLERGWNVVTPDLRAAGESEGKYITMGVKESDDVALWIKKIINVDPNAEIVLHGVSMGAATVMMTTAKDLPKNVRAAVEDCGYTSAYEMFADQLKKIFQLPEVPIMPCVDLISRIESGCAISDAAPIKVVNRTKVPMLFIHGDADMLIPHAMMIRLFEASEAPSKENWTVTGAGHAEAKPTNPTAYFEHMFEFIDRFVD